MTLYLSVCCPFWRREGGKGKQNKEVGPFRSVKSEKGSMKMLVLSI